MAAIRPHPETRLESLITWFAASVLTAAAVVYALKRDERQAKPAKPGFSAESPANESLSLQHARAQQPGRGRSAATPRQIPWRGWKDIFVRTYNEIGDDRLLSLAAGVVFYSLVALFPALAATVAVYAFFSDAASIAGHLNLLADFVPGATLELLGAEITRIAGTAEGKLTFGFLIGFAIALWSANAGMKAIFDALNIIYDEEEKRSFIKLNLVRNRRHVDCCWRRCRVSADPCRLRMVVGGYTVSDRARALAGDVYPAALRAGSPLSLRTEP
jgi:membrane protein